MPVANLTKRAVDAALPRSSRYTLFDAKLTGFGLRVFPSGEKSWVIEYRPGARGRSIAKRRFTLGPVGTLTPDEARSKAEELLAQARLGGDPAAERAKQREASTLGELARLFLSEHAQAKRKPRTAAGYADILIGWLCRVWEAERRPKSPAPTWPSFTSSSSRRPRRPITCSPSSATRTLLVPVEALFRRERTRRRASSATELPVASAI